MAVRSISTSDTLETFRTQFNALAANDFGDIANLDPSLSATTVIGAVNELSAAVTAGLSIIMEDDASTTQSVSAGQTMKFSGTANQITAVVSVPDTLTIGLPNDVTIANDLTVSNDISITGALTASGTSHTLGNLTLANGSITDSSGAISFSNENLSTTGTLASGNTTITGTLVVSSTTTLQGNAVVSGTISAGGIESNANAVSLKGGSGTYGVIFEGSSADNFETRLTAENATAADRTITLPNESGTVVTTGSSGVVTSTMIASSTITNDDIANSTIRAEKLNLSADTLTVDTLNANTITGAASVAQLVNCSANNTTNETTFVTFVDGATGNQGIETDTDLTYNPSTGVLGARATSANYADLAEKYAADQEYKPGTILEFGGDAEVQAAGPASNKIAGVVSTQPAYLMNSMLEGTTADVALIGRVPCRVIGTIKKGDIIVSVGGGVGRSFKPSSGCSCGCGCPTNATTGSVVGKSLENYDSEEEGLIEIAVGRL